MINVEKIEPTGLFTNYIYKAIPLAFDESMSYYETLCGLLSYLKDTVIPTLNNNADAIVEVQNLYNELHDYVEHYFDNLDVQEEINNKLDTMIEDGSFENIVGLYIQPRIDAQDVVIQDFKDYINDEIENFENSINSDINDINNIVTNVASGSPLTATSTSEMLDTSRIYVNTTDGNWYYYDGTDWQIGGQYQSSGIADNSISIYKLDDLLQSNFDINYSQPLELGTAYTGYYKNDGTLNEDTSYINFHYNLVNGKKYIFNGFDSSLLQSIVIKDSSNNLIYVSNPNNQTKNECLIFECNENNLTAYMSVFKSGYEQGSSYNYKMFMLRELTNIYNNLKYSSIIPEIESFIGFTLASNLSATPPVISFNVNDTNGEVKFYQMNKGITYKIHAWDYSNICGLLVVDNYKNIIYASSTSNIGDTRTEFDYEFTAEFDGTIILTTYQSNRMPTSIEKINNNINIINTNSNLLNKKISINGDSIAYGVGYSGGYGKIIADMYNMDYQNIAVGGATISSNTYSGETPRTWINETITNMAIDSDFAILEGGVNDSSLGVPLGAITSGYNDVLDTSTYYGAFENMLKQLINRFKGKKYGYIAVHQMTANYRIINEQSTSYYWASKKCCEKWGVPFLDLNDKVPPFAFLNNTPSSSISSDYTLNGDGWHPNEQGYKKYYVNKIINWLESL